MTIDVPALRAIGTRSWPPPPPGWPFVAPPPPGPGRHALGATKRRPDAPVGTILSARGVRKIYRSGVHEIEALRGIDIDVDAGELVMVMGPSGNGKTTMLNCLSGLDEIDAGTVYVDGDEIHTMPDGQRTEHR
ncbi:MAG: ATP-binding cassette domain-containing protein, partial [Actinomycetota bacterium]|nr:ATP-binding cassette domain-containing protein [Actinomycetota bacterium]